MTAEPPAQTVKSGDIARVMTLLPHRYPFLMVDRMVEMVLGERAVGLKNVSVNEPHFPSSLRRAGESHVNTIRYVFSEWL